MTETENNEFLKDSGRIQLSDKKFDCEINNRAFINKLFTRLVAKEVTFKKINFSYCIFDSAYLRKCIFDGCNFTGCRFVNSNLTGSSFKGCNFEYATFDKTHVDNDILLSSCPGRENLKLKFARSLRINFQQLGDAQSANRAMSIELYATEQHLLKAWHSTESYYRTKYHGWKRLQAFIDWLGFKSLDLIWGNGEKASRLLVVACIVFFIIGEIHTYLNGDFNSLASHLSSISISPLIFLGIEKTMNYHPMYLASIHIVRLILFGFFLSIIIKRFNKR